MKGGATMPAGTDWPRITTRLTASRLIAMFIASRTRLSAKGFLPLTSELRSSVAPWFMPKKIVRFSGPERTTMPLAADRRSRSCTGGSSRKSISPESSAATRVAAERTGVNTTLATSIGYVPLPQ